MKIMNWKNTISLFFILLLSSCVEPYLPEVMQGPNSYLVVNGFINASGPSTIQLLRTQNLDEETMPPAENGAIVMIEAEDGEQYGVHQQGNGIYVSGDLTLDSQKKYRLFIRTRNGREYASEYVEVKHTPAIDEVNWEPVDGKVEVSVNTHDPANDTWYYRWEYEHTWHFRSAFFTPFKYIDGRIDYRDENDEDIYNCWKTEQSTTIELSNSKRLTEDRINKYKLLAIPSNSEKVAIKYSILVKQYALTQEAYSYWETLKKNTEEIGTLFDPLPSQLNGNIRSLDDSNEPVIGYISASTMQQKRIFIDSKELPREWSLFAPSCYSDTMYLAQASVVDYFKEGYIMPVTGIYVGGSMSPIGYVYADKSCVDCRTAGTNVKPYFWE